MRAIAWLTLAAIGLTGCARAGRAQTEHHDSLAARVDSIFASWDTQHSPGCILGVSQNGLSVYERGYGMANLEDGIAITPASIFHVASITKQFTAMAVLILVQRGRLSLDDDVRAYVPELPDYGTRLTLRHLLTHTSGLRDVWDMQSLTEPREPGADDVVRLLGRQTALNFLPGTEYAYLNVGYALLGRIVERVSGESLRSFADANIFRPLGMTHTFFHDDPRMIIPNRAAGYESDNAGGWRIAVDSWTGSAGGNTGLYTTARDLLIWQQNFADPRVGDPALVAGMQAPTVLSGGDTSFYGLGTQVTPYHGLRTVGHSGSDPGYTADMIRFPDYGLALAVLCNREGTSASTLSRRVADVFLATVFRGRLDDAARVPLPTVSLATEQVAGMVGLYRNRSSDALRRIFVRAGTLMGRAGAFAGTGGGTALRPVSANRFFLPGDLVSLEFVPSADGRGLEIHEAVAGRRPLVFERENEFAPSRSELNAFAGEYVSSELEATYIVLAVDSGLVVRIRGRADRVLRPIFADAFQGSGLGLLKFARDARGAVNGFALTRSDVRGLRFDRVVR